MTLRRALLWLGYAMDLRRCGLCKQFVTPAQLIEGGGCAVCVGDGR